MQIKRFIIFKLFVLTGVIFFWALTPVYAHHEPAFFQDMFEKHGSIMLLVEVETGAIHYSNQAAAAFYGYSVEQLQSMNIQEINMLSPSEIEAERRAAALEERNYFTFPHRLANGEVRTVDVYSWPFQIEGTSMLFSIVKDVTDGLLAQEALRERTRLFFLFMIMAILIQLFIILLLARSNKNQKKSQEALRQSEEKYRLIFEHSPLGILHFDNSGIITACNNSFVNIIGSSREQLVGLNMLELPDQVVVDSVKGVLTGKPITREGVYQAVTSTNIISCRAFFQPVFSEIRQPIGGVGIVEDITQRKQAEDNLKHSEREKSLILDAISERITYLDRNYRVIWANRMAAESVNMNIEELSGKICYEIWYQRKKPCLGCPVIKAYGTKQPQEGEMITPDGRCWFLRGYPLLDHEQEIMGIIKIGQDITEKKAAELELKESEQRFRGLVELAPDAIFVQAEKKFLYLNQAAVDLFGAESKEQLIGMPVMERFHPDYHQKVSKRIELLNQRKEPVPWLEQIYLKLDGTPVDVEVSAVPISFESKDGALVYVRDITQRKEKERGKMNELALQRQQQKLEAIGVLASGVAHEINNPVNGIMNYGQLILDNEQPGSNNADYAAEIIHECERVSSIVQNLLQYARYEKHSHSPAQVEDIIERTLSLISTIIRKDQIRLEVNIPKGLPSLKCRSQQIQQVLMNLLTNARDALNIKYPGYHENKIILITCCDYTKDNKRWIRVTVEDHGTGIAESIHEKLYEPFFTTKSRELGTGLGMAISYGILQEHNGHMSFKTKTGDGSYTEFYLDLPVDNGWSIEIPEE